jgi:methionyl-tRNA formyltransferase
LKHKIFFFGTPEFAVPSLRSLLSVPEIEIVAVVTQPDRVAGRGLAVKKSAIKLLAESCKIPVLQPESIKKAEAFFKDFNTNRARSGEATYVGAVVVAYGQILPRWLLENFSNRCINVHGSLLPRWRGAAPIQRALISGDATTGVSLMQIDSGMDSGPVYLTKEYAIQESCTFGSLSEDLAKIGADLLTSTIVGILSDEIQPTPQPLAGIVHAKKIDKSEALINWDQSSQTIKNLIHALSPTPGAFTYIKSKRFKVLEVRAHPTPEKTHQNGIIFSDVSSEKTRYFVQCNEGAIELLTVQIEGKSSCSAEEFARGYKDFIGTCLSNLKTSENV